MDISILEANKQLCRDYFTAFLKRDVDWMQKHIAPSFVRHDPEKIATLLKLIS